MSTSNIEEQTRAVQAPESRSYARGLAHVLIVDDCEIEAELANRVLRKLGVPCHSHVVHDGEAALSFLRRQGPHSGAPRPHLVFMDIKMPRMGGLEALAEIKRDETLRGIPIVMLSSSSDGRDVEKAYRQHADGYLIKPVQVESFRNMLRKATDYWLDIVVLP